MMILNLVKVIWWNRILQMHLLALLKPKFMSDVSYFFLNEFPEWVFCFIYTCTENVRSIFEDIRRLDWYEMLRCGTVQIVPNCLPNVYFIIYLMFTLSSHYITLPRSYSIIEHVTWSLFMSCDNHVTHREDLSYSNNVLDDRWSTIVVKLDWISRNFKTFLKPNLSFLRKNHMNDN